MATLTNAQILSAISSDSNTSDRLKDLIANHTNLENLANAITSDNFELEKNAFIDTLVNGIAKRIAVQKIMKNIFAEFKGGKIPYGSQENLIQANPAIRKEYDMSSKDLLTQTMPDIKSIYFKINRQDRYDVTVSDIQLTRALINPYGLSELIQMIVGTLYNGDNIDEMLLTKQLMVNAVLNKNVKKVICKTSSTAYTDNDPSMTVGVIDMTGDEETKYKNLMKEIRTLSYNFTVASDKYNASSKIVGDDEKALITCCDSRDQVFIPSSEVLANIDVELLAHAFNMSKTDFIQRIIPTNDFNGMKILGILCDKSWFKIEDALYSLRAFNNGSNLTRNYWLHHHEIISYNMLANCVVFLDSTDKSLNNA